MDITPNGFVSVVCKYLLSTFPLDSVLHLSSFYAQLCWAMLIGWICQSRMSDKYSHPDTVHIFQPRNRNWIIILKISLLHDTSRLHWSPCRSRGSMTTKSNADAETHDGTAVLREYEKIYYSPSQALWRERGRSPSSPKIAWQTREVWVASGGGARISGLLHGSWLLWFELPTSTKSSTQAFLSACPDVG